MSENIDLTTIGTDEYIRWVQEDRKAKKIYVLDGELSLLSSKGGNCIFCIHFDIDNHIHRQHIHKCAAFDDIPLVIWEEKYDHNNPYPNDKGIQFSKIPETGN
jgi:hypothetical protein